MTEQNKERIIQSIKQRILDEQRKHSSLDWAEIAARKIYATFQDYQDLEEVKIPEKITPEDLNRYRGHGYLTVKSLKEHLKERDYDDDALVMIQRIEDMYYNKNSWSVLLKEGEHYHNAIQMNENMKAEVERRERGETPEYGMDDPSKYIHPVGEDSMEQYHPAWCCVWYKNDKELFIDLHY